MIKKFSFAASILLAAGSLTMANPAVVHADETDTENAAPALPSFDVWLADFRKQAAADGISEATLDATLTGLQPDPRILDFDQRQPEFVQTFWDYLNNRVTETRIDAGKALLKSHAELFAAVEQKHGIPSRYLVAFWGLETNYGSHMGQIAIIPALATLAYDARRSDFFRAQLLDALRIVDDGDIPASDLRGSWAGAIGHMQFIPSTFLRYGEDGDGDGKINTRASLPDALYSAANYLEQAGWRKDQGWGEEVKLPKDFNWALARLDRRRPIQEWRSLGVTRVDGSALPDEDGTVAIVLPQGYAGPAVLVRHNFYVMLRWNRSINYAISVGQLADRLAGMPAFSTGLDADNRRLSREQATNLQKCLIILGYDPGPADGVPGSRTVVAIRAYQTSAGLPVDGYPSVTLLEELHTTLQEKSLPLPTDAAPSTAAIPNAVNTARLAGGSP